MWHLREKGICVFREFDFRGDGEKICYITAPVWLNRSLLGVRMDDEQIMNGLPVQMDNH